MVSVTGMSTHCPAFILSIFSTQSTVLSVYSLLNLYRKSAMTQGEIKIKKKTAPTAVQGLSTCSTFSGFFCVMYFALAYSQNDFFSTFVSRLRTPAPVPSPSSNFNLLPVLSKKEEAEEGGKKQKRQISLQVILLFKPGTASAGSPMKRSHRW